MNSYGSTGYNATKGGDGTLLYDYNQIIELYKIGYNQKQVALQIRCCEDTVRKVLKTHNIKTRGSTAKKIYQFDLKGNFIQSFWGCLEVAQWLINNKLAKSTACHRHITNCCNNKNKTAYGYIWKYTKIYNMNDHLPQTVKVSKESLKRED